MSEIHWWLFPLGILLDLIWVFWMASVEKMWMWRAGFWGMMTAAVGIIATVDIVHDPIQSIPYLGGLFFGSVAGVWFKRRKHNADVNSRANQAGSKTD